MNKKGTGLNATPVDPNFFKLGGVFGNINIKDVPLEDFDFSTVKYIKDQTDKDFCAGYSTSSVSEDQEEIILGPNFQFSRIKKVLGEFESWGADLRAAVLACVKFGSIPLDEELSFLKNNPQSEDRDYLANWNNWPKKFDDIALKFKKSSVFEVTGPFDAFDNVRAAIWQHRADKAGVVVGVKWRYSWNNAENGILGLARGDGEGHALKLKPAQKIINGVPYLVIQNSWGEGVGDKGLFYVGRDIFNSEFAPYKCFMFKDMPKEVAKYLTKNNLTASSTWWVQIITTIQKLFTVFKLAK